MQRATMARSKKSKESTLVLVLICVIILEVSRLERERAKLKEDLRAMECKGLLAKPWNLCNEEVVTELTTTKKNKWEYKIWMELS